MFILKHSTRFPEPWDAPDGSMVDPTQLDIPIDALGIWWLIIQPNIKSQL